MKPLCPTAPSSRPGGRITPRLNSILMLGDCVGERLAMEVVLIDMGLANWL